MKKLFLSFLLGFFLVIPLTVYAIDLGGGLVKKAAVDTAGYASATDTSFAELIGSIIKSALSFVGVIFLVLMVYAGYLWMTARGEESQIEKAQSIIKSSIIGMVVAVGAFSITTFVMPRILEKTTGSTGAGASGGSAEQESSVYCCMRCDDATNNCTTKSVASEDECTDFFGSCQGNNVDYTCSVSVVPQSQCGAEVKQVQCCSVSYKDPQTGKDVSYKQQGIGEDRCAAQCGGNNVDCDYSYDLVQESQCN